MGEIETSGPIKLSGDTGRHPKHSHNSMRKKLLRLLAQIYCGPCEVSIGKMFGTATKKQARKRKEGGYCVFKAGWETCRPLNADELQLSSTQTIGNAGWVFTGFQPVV